MAPRKSCLGADALALTSRTPLFPGSVMAARMASITEARVLPCSCLREMLQMGGWERLATVARTRREITPRRSGARFSRFVIDSLDRSPAARYQTDQGPHQRQQWFSHEGKESPRPQRSCLPLAHTVPLGHPFPPPHGHHHYPSPQGTRPHAEHIRGRWSCHG